MSVNACCCLSSKDSAVAVGIWSLVFSLASLLLFGWQTAVLNHCRVVTMAQANLQVFSIAQLGIMGWQMAAIKYERDRAANTLLPNYQTYGKFDIPSYYESYWQSPEERYYTGLFVIQVLCLIGAFFNMFASAGMIYGVHIWSRRLIWPWFPCMITCILTSLAYCIMWWCGDVRDYWLAITIIEIIGVFINIYCVVVVLMYYRRLNATTDEYEGKDRMVRYKINRMGGHSSRRDLLESYDGLHRSPEVPKGGYPYKPLAQPSYIPPPSKPYPAPYSPTGVPQAPLPLPPAYGNTPYPVSPAEATMQRYDKEPKASRPATYHSSDPVASWVEDQQVRRDHIDANSEPISPSRQVHATTYPVQHSRSVPSLYDGTLVSHKDCRHHKHRSSSRHKHRSRSRNRYDDSLYYSSESDSDFTRRRDGSRRRHRSRSRYSESEMTFEPEQHRRSSHRDSHRHRHDHNRDSEVRRSDRRRSSGRRHRDDEERESQRRRRDRDSRDDERPGRIGGERISKDSGAADIPQEGGTFPLNGGITIPQHIVIPPSAGERDPHGNPLPQKFQINSEITINYDKNGQIIQQNGYAAPSEVRQAPGINQPTPRATSALRDGGSYPRRNMVG